MKNLIREFCAAVLELDYYTVSLRNAVSDNDNEMILYYDDQRNFWYGIASDLYITFSKKYGMSKSEINNMLWDGCEMDFDPESWQAYDRL